MGNKTKNLAWSAITKLSDDLLPTVRELHLQLLAEHHPGLAYTTAQIRATLAKVLTDLAEIRTGLEK